MLLQLARFHNKTNCENQTWGTFFYSYPLKEVPKSLKLHCPETSDLPKENNLIKN